MEVRVTHQGRVLAEIEIFQDGQVQVRSAQGPGAPQYVWGAQPQGGGGPQGVGAPQYVWGAQPQGNSAQYVWGATNNRPESRDAAVAVDCPSATPAPTDAGGIQVTEPLVGR